MKDDQAVQAHGIDPLLYEKLNNFEQQLAQFFPEVFAFLMLGRMKDHGGGGERHLNTLIDNLIEMNDKGTSGSIIIDYTEGHIVRMDKKVNLLYKKSGQGGY